MAGITKVAARQHDAARPVCNWKFGVRIYPTRELRPEIGHIGGLNTMVHVRAFEFGGADLSGSWLRASPDPPGDGPRYRQSHQQAGGQL